MIRRSMLVGASGRIGRMVVRSWRASASDWAQDPAHYRAMPEGINTTSGDLFWDPADGIAPVCEWMERAGRITCLTILAGVTPTTGKDMKENVTIAKTYLDAAQRLGIKRVLLASSSAVYGPGDGTPLSENARCAPVSAYGAAKLEMEAMAAHHARDELEICCLRIGNVAGADALLLKADGTSTATPLQIDTFENGHGPLRSYIGPGSLGYVLGSLAYYPGSLPFLLNIAAIRPVHMDQLADAAGLPWRGQTASAGAIQDVILNCDRLASLVTLSRDTGSVETLIREWREYRR